ncbi:hypothetical protein D3C77_769890 [compost metagenome]
MAQKGKFQAHSVVADVSVASRLTQALVTVASDNFSGEGGERVFTQVLDELLGFVDFAPLGRWLFGGGNVA